MKLDSRQFSKEAHTALVEIKSELAVTYHKKAGSSRLCVIIFAYVRLNAYWARLLGLF
ncbi:hypothetical protein MICAF_5090003 [Microcystis aeruginosa PCC 9807]|uniref:Uncharacterized protein n=1 Tax=Microcystis aeruginosa PCC 9807 TaxID=1160283 RepID=I4HBR0_MICAE|nr:hypothetical protein [Microcystis aeruginosa]CCI19484.1 hypothetical protein MICAF_5090003 [Microcystis aeruginosa PCC 9807]